MFRIFLSLLASAGLALLLGYGLLHLGIVEIPKAKVHRAKRLLASRDLFKTIEPRGKNAAKPASAEKEDEPTLGSQTANSPQSKAATPIENTKDQVQTRTAAIIAFLTSLTRQQEDEAEILLARFLRKELGLNKDEVRQVRKQCFWKGFVTLQQDWIAAKDESVQQAFQTELALKKAGFAAKGLQLMQSEIEAARSGLPDPEENKMLSQDHGGRS